jgi:hypothetical protein
MTYITSDADGVDKELADKIRDALERQYEGVAIKITGQEQWADATYDLAVSLAKARDRFPANQEFSDWLEAEGINITKDDRAALIAMGREPERARQVLNETLKTSVRRIYNEEFRVRTPAKTTKQAAKDVAPSSETKTAEPVDTINPALAAEVLALRKENAALATELNKLKIKFDTEVQKRVDAYTKEAYGNDVAKALKRAQQMNRAIYPLTEAQMKVIIRGCHPDTAADMDARTEAMALLNAKRDALIGPPKVKGPQREFVPPPMPDSLSAHFAKIEAMKAEEAALRKAAKGAARH